MLLETRGWPHEWLRSHTGLCTQKFPRRGLILCCHCFQILITDEQGTLHFHFALGFENDVAGCGCAFLWGCSHSCIRCLSLLHGHVNILDMLSVAHCASRACVFPCASYHSLRAFSRRINPFSPSKLQVRARVLSYTFHCLLSLPPFPESHALWLL